jgi:outer membrane lipoprotein-sorting protein
MNWSHVGRKLGIAAGLVLSLTLARAADDLPKAETILDKYVDATGGKAAYLKHHTEITKGTMDITAFGVKGTVITYSAEPNKSYTEVDLPGLGKTSKGTDGKVYWMQSAMVGAHIEEGAEKAQSMLSRMNAELVWRELFKEVKTVGTDSVDGKECYKVEMTPTEGGPITQCYDKQSNLILKMTMTMTSQMGEQTVDSFFSDYRKEDDVLMPHKMKQNVAGQDIVFTVDSVTFNPDIPADKFTLPSEIKALANKK